MNEILPVETNTSELINGVDHIVSQLSASVPMTKGVCQSQQCKEPDEHILRVIEGIRGEFEMQTGLNVTKFDALTVFSMEAGSGMNYIVKVQTDNEIVHLRLYEGA